MVFLHFRLWVADLPGFDVKFVSSMSKSPRGQVLSWFHCIGDVFIRRSSWTRRRPRRCFSLFFWYFSLCCFCYFSFLFLLFFPRCNSASRRSSWTRRRPQSWILHPVNGFKKNWRWFFFIFGSGWRICLVLTSNSSPACQNLVWVLFWVDSVGMAPIW